MAPPTQPATDPARRPRTPWPVLLLLAVACAAATFFLLGDTGHFNDDYFYNQRDVVTGEIRALLLDRPYHVWRPLFKVIVPALHTLFWNHNWAMHLVSTLVHAMVAWLLLRLLVRLGMTVRVSAAAAILFAVWPAHFEAELWSCCLPTLLGSALLLAMAHWHLAWIDQREQPNGLLAIAPFAFAACGFAVAALNEQPAGPIAAFPLLGLLVPAARTLPRRVLARRSLVPIIAAGLALLWYVRCHFHHVGRPPAPSVVGDDTPLPGPLARIAAQIASIAHDAPGQLVLSGFGDAARAVGLEALAAHPWLAGSFGAALLIAAVLAGRWWLREGDDPPASSADAGTDLTLHPGHLVFVLVFAAAWVVAAWVPIFVIHGVTTSRLHYVPDLGLAIGLAALLQLIRNALLRPAGPGPLGRGFNRGVGFGLLLVVLAPSLVAMIGVQEAYQRRSRRDLSEMGALAALTADAVEPDTLFLPVMVSSRVAETGAPRFDGYFLGAWNWDYAAGWLMQQSFRRTDAHVVLAGLDTPLRLYWISGQERSTALLCERLARPQSTRKPVRNPDGKGRLMSWDLCLPFRVERDGEVRLFTKVRLSGSAGPDGSAIEFVPAQTARVLAKRLLPELVLIVEPAPEKLLHSKRFTAGRDKARE